LLGITKKEAFKDIRIEEKSKTKLRDGEDNYFKSLEMKHEETCLLHVIYQA